MSVSRVAAADLVPVARSTASPGLSPTTAVSRTVAAGPGDALDGVLGLRFRSSGPAVGLTTRS